MSLADLFSKLKNKSKAAVLQLFTPGEFKALLIFLGVGLAVLLYRGGKELIHSLYPPAIPDAVALREYQNDSIFAALSRKVINEDSLNFSIPDDSLISKDKAVSTYENKKAKDLSPHSIPLNKADHDALEKLPGVGKVTADRILAYRSKRGGFRAVREVMNIQGIGEKKFKEMETYLRLD